MTVIHDFLDSSTSMIDFPEDKNELKKVYQNIKGKALNG